MNITDSQLSFELQELYLENKENNSNILFLDGETRFFATLFAKVLSALLKDGKAEEVEFINSSLAELKSQREKLKVLLNSQKHSIEIILKDVSKKIDTGLIDRNMHISCEIKLMFDANKLRKSELYAFVEQVMADQKAVRAVTN